ncbi:Crp/Fnr family transcriptional regulator [Aquimarina sp. MMG015]|uniref:Crp/Fnr family transcriptional regulator n=1 Tax=Aquimarina TaxID=290174 RepID=UPI000403FE43|nr:MULTISPECIES: Crp/Fnr family transcriptional regulator [Aquimarina]AXT55509.1 Crp/Fnr family transcriptional regulator [Aquimarina sp. AD1]MBQ4802488.1 Crp/Fnr family transcriptional regulator [Aquimarina sp. MMG015]
MKDLEQKIRSFTPVSDSDMEYGLQFYKKEIYKKGAYLVKPEQSIQDFYFMKKGCVTYYTIEEGVTRVMEFFTEGSFFTDLYPYIEEIPSESYLEVIEDSIVYTISKTDALKVFDYSHALERFGRLSMQKAFINNFQRINRMKNLSNQERYLQLLEKRPSLFQRVPQYLIASYLGLTPVGLSKIRKRLSQQ